MRTSSGGKPWRCGRGQVAVPPHLRRDLRPLVGTPDARGALLQRGSSVVTASGKSYGRADASTIPLGRRRRVRRLRQVAVVVVGREPEPSYSSRAGGLLPRLEPRRGRPPRGPPVQQGGHHREGRAPGGGLRPTWTPRSRPSRRRRGHPLAPPGRRAVTTPVGRRRLFHAGARPAARNRGEWRGRLATRNACRRRGARHPAVLRPARALGRVRQHGRHRAAPSGPREGAHPVTARSTRGGARVAPRRAPSCPARGGGGGALRSSHPQLLGPAPSSRFREQREPVQLGVAGETRCRTDGRGGTGLPVTMSASRDVHRRPPDSRATTHTPSPHAVHTPSTSVIAGPPEGPVSPRQHPADDDARADDVRAEVLGRGGSVGTADTRLGCPLIPSPPRLRNRRNW